MATKFSELLKASMKSEDTEEWIDIYFTRPIGLAFALMWKALGVHPNAITILSIFLGLGAGYMFYFPDIEHNIWGVVLLMFANFCDSTDGQLARLTGQKTLVGRMLDGFSGDVWFFAIYLAIALRLMDEPRGAIGDSYSVSWLASCATRHSRRSLTITDRFTSSSYLARKVANSTTTRANAPFTTRCHGKATSGRKCSTTITPTTAVARRNEHPSSRLSTR